jgi:hypothetical protein
MISFRFKDPTLQFAAGRIRRGGRINESRGESQDVRLDEVMSLTPLPQRWNWRDKPS